MNGRQCLWISVLFIMAILPGRGAFGDCAEVVDSTGITVAHIDDFTDHSYLDATTALGNFHDCLVTRNFAGPIQSLKVNIVSGQADDVGYVGSMLVTTVPPPCGGVGTVQAPIDVTSQVAVTGNSASLVLRAQDTCCCQAGWGDIPPRPPARLHWEVTLSGSTGGTVVNVPTANFGDVPLGQSHKISTFGGSVTPGTTFTFTGSSLTGPDASAFTVSDSTCFGTAPTCTWAITFTPQHPGVHNATFILNAIWVQGGTPVTYIYPLTGNGVGGPTGLLIASPGLLDFGSQPVGTSSATQTVTVANESSSPVPISSAGIEGVDAGNFRVTGDSGQGTLLPSATRTINVSFTPSATGPRRASLVIHSGADSSPTFTVLSGTGTPAQITVQTLASVGTPVAAAGRLALLGADSPDPGSSVSGIRGIGDDGSLFVLDYAGTALLRLPSPAGAAVGPAEILLDTTRQNTPDGTGLARLLRVETNRNGVSVVLALRADNTRGIYRLDKGALTLLAILPEARGPAELTIDDAGQIAYVAPNASGVPALFQAPGGTGIELLHRGQTLSDDAVIGGFSDLTGNAQGDLAVLVLGPDGSSLAVLRKRVGILEVIALRGQSAARAHGDSSAGFLTQLRRPRIGPDGTVLFQGSGDNFSNFFAARPGGTLVPVLTGTDWSSDSATFDYDLSSTGAIAVRAVRGSTADSGLYRVAANGEISQVVGGRRDIQPAGRPVFAPDDTLFFSAQNLDLPSDRNGRPLTGLFRSHLGEGSPVGVALAGQPVPIRAARLLSVPQAPVITASGVIFGALIGGPEMLPVPTAALFRVPLSGILAQGELVIGEGAPVVDAGRLAIVRDVSYQGDGTLVFDGLLPGGGPVVAPTTAPAVTASVVRTHAQPVAALVPLVSTGDDLGVGQLETTLPPLLSLGPDRELFIARVSPPGALDREGLFTASRTRHVEQVAVTRQELAHQPGAVFNGMADTRIFSLNPPAVAPDGNVVFKALLDQSGAVPAGTPPALGVFQWASGAAPTAVALSDGALVAGDPLPYQFEHWAAGKGGLVYLQARTPAGKARVFAGTAGTPLKPLIEPGVTAVLGTSSLADLTDFVLDQRGELFVAGTAGGKEGVFHLASGLLAPVALQGDVLPPLADGRGSNFVFLGTFQLLPQSARGDLMFRALSHRSRDPQVRQGSFRWRQGHLETLTLAGVGVAGERALTVDALSDTLEVQNAGDTAVSAYFSAQQGWVIVRSQVNGDRTAVISIPIAQEKRGTLPGVRQFAALDVGPLLDQEGLAPRSGPIFTINEAGDIAFLASDGKGWGVYQAPH